jgi:hypothetical protein
MPRSHFTPLITVGPAVLHRPRMVPRRRDIAVTPGTSPVKTGTNPWLSPRNSWPSGK